jgi:hypothetical protein
MKLRNAVLTGGGIGAALIFGCCLLSPMAYSATHCSAGTLQGHYVFTGQGINLHYGAFDFDGRGKVSGEQTSVRNKVAKREVLQGTYTLDAGCAGTMIFDGQLGGTAHWDLFVTDDGRKGNMIRTDSVSMGVRTFEK